MKNLIFIILTLVCFNSLGQSTKVNFPVDKDSVITYQEVLTLKDTTTSKSKLYAQTQLWFANTFTNSKNVLQIDDKESGRLLGKGNSTLLLPPTINALDMKYTIEVVVKNGKLRYKIYNISLFSSYYNQEITLDDTYRRYNNDNPSRQIFESKKAAIKRYEAIYLAVDKSVNSLILSLKRSLASTNKDDF